MWTSALHINVSLCPQFGNMGGFCKEYFNSITQIKMSSFQKHLKQQIILKKNVLQIMKESYINMSLYLPLVFEVSNIIILTWWKNHLQPVHITKMTTNHGWVILEDLYCNSNYGGSELQGIGNFQAP